MTTLENYEKRFGLAELTPDEILNHVENAQGHMAMCTSHGLRTTSADDDRVLIWLYDTLLATNIELGMPPVLVRCVWCFRAGPATGEAWRALPKMSLDDAAAHSQVCDHNPLVRKIRELEASIEEVRQVALERDL